MIVTVVSKSVWRLGGVGLPA